MDKETQKNLLDIVKRNYEEIADDFSETRKKYLWPELVHLAGFVKDGDSVLDAGCGNGRLLEALKDKKINYVGIDNSKRLISIAKKRNWKFEIARLPARQGNLKFFVWDLLSLDMLSFKKFDYIFCIAVLHHIPGEDLRLKVLRNLKEKLKGDGKIILTVWNLWGQKKFRDLIFKSVFLKLMGKNHRLGGAGKMDFGDILFDWKNSGGKAVSQRYYHAFNTLELKKIIKRAGLNIEKIYKDKYNHYAILCRDAINRVSTLD